MSLLTLLLRFTTQTHHNSTQAGGGGRDSGEVELLGCLSLSRSSCSSDMDPQCRWHWREHGHQICDLCDELHCFVPPQRREVLVHCSLQPTNWQQRYYVWKKSDPRRSLWVCLSMYIYVRLLFQIKQLFFTRYISKIIFQILQITHLSVTPVLWKRAAQWLWPATPTQTQLWTATPGTEWMEIRWQQWALRTGSRLQSWKTTASFTARSQTNTEPRTHPSFRSMCSVSHTDTEWQMINKGQQHELNLCLFSQFLPKKRQ